MKVFGAAAPALSFATTGLVSGDTLTGNLSRAAVELAKDFGSQSSPRFVNGVLSSVSKEEEIKGG